MNNHDYTGSNAKLYDMLSGKKRKTVWVAWNVEHEMGWVEKDVWLKGRAPSRWRWYPQDGSLRGQ